MLYSEIFIIIRCQLKLFKYMDVAGCVWLNGRALTYQAQGSGIHPQPHLGEINQSIYMIRQGWSARCRVQERWVLAFLSLPVSMASV